jgi:basic membrane protein A
LRHLTKLAALAGASALLLAGCGEKPSDENSASGSGGGGEKFKACMVLDVGGVDDKSFNQSAWQGMQDAKKANSDIDVSYVQSQGDADYEPNLQNSVQKNCDVTLAVGGLLATAAEKVAKATPDSHFAIIDSGSNGVKNLYGITFHNEQGGFLAGYVAASLSKTGKIGTWGGIDVGPPVTGYMDGYKQGAEYWGQQNKKPMKVLGWDGKKGSFANSFTDTGVGKTTTEALVQQGADVIFPVAGGAGAGAFDVAQAQGGKVDVIWVDFPGCDYYPEDCKYIPTSALKAIPQNVKDYVTKAADGDVPEGTYEGTLENDGVGIDAFNEFDSKISDETKAGLDQVREDVISGKIKITVNQ